MAPHQGPHTKQSCAQPTILIPHKQTRQSPIINKHNKRNIRLVRAYVTINSRFPELANTVLSVRLNKIVSRALNYRLSVEKTCNEVSHEVHGSKFIKNIAPYVNYDNLYLFRNLLFGDIGSSICAVS